MRAPTVRFFGVREPLRHLAGRGQDERVRARGRRLDRAERRVVELHELPELREVRTQQGQVVALVQAAQPAQAVGAVGAVQREPHRVAGVGRVGQQAAVAAAAPPPARSRGAAGRAGGRRSTGPCDRPYERARGRRRPPAQCASGRDVEQGASAGGGLVDVVDGGGLELVLVGVRVVRAEQQVPGGEDDADAGLGPAAVTAVGSGQGGGGGGGGGAGHACHNTTLRAGVPVEAPCRGPRDWSGARPRCSRTAR